MKSQSTVERTKPLRRCIAGFLVVLPTFASCNRSAPVTDAKPSIRFSESAYSAKPIDGHVLHKFQITNDGQDTLQIKDIKSSCGCAVTTLKDNKIEPGESAWLEVDLSASPTKRESTIVVFSSDPVDPAHRLVVGAEFDFSGLS